MNKEEIQLHNKVGDIGSDHELRDGYVSNSNIHDLLYSVLELFESSIDKRLQTAELKWLRWFFGIGVWRRFNWSVNWNAATVTVTWFMKDL